MADRARNQDGLAKAFTFKAVTFKAVTFNVIALMNRFGAWFVGLLLWRPFARPAGPLKTYITRGTACSSTGRSAASTGCGLRYTLLRCRSGKS